MPRPIELVTKEDVCRTIKAEWAECSGKYYPEDIIKDTCAAIEGIPVTLTGFNWIPVSDRQPFIDMSFPHSVPYLVKYKDGGYDVARWTNVNRFWSGQITEPYWICEQFCEVEAWMTVPPYFNRKENEEEK